MNFCYVEKGLLASAMKSGVKKIIVMNLKSAPSYSKIFGVKIAKSVIVIKPGKKEIFCLYM